MRSVYQPYAQALVAVLAHRTLVLAMDDSDVERGWLILLVSAAYKKRALLIAWIVVKGRQGYFLEEAHVKLLAEIHSMVQTPLTRGVR